MGRRQTGGKAATDFVVGIEHKLNSTQVANMVRSIHLQWNGVGRPTIDVDASIYLYQFALRKKGPVKELAAFLAAWASTGIDVACIFDPFCGARDDTKRATVQRSGARMAKKFKAFDAKSKLMRLVHCLQNEDSQPADFNVASAKSDISNYEKIIKAGSQPGISGLMTARLPLLLKEAIDCITTTPGCGNINFITAKTQADATIAYRLLNGISQMVLSSDTDFGHLCGDRCLQVHCSFAAQRKHGVDPFEKVEVSSTFSSAMITIAKAIHRDESIISEPPYPLFDGRSPWWRALIAVAIGCDQCPLGVPGINTKILWSWFKNNPACTEEDFLEFLVNPPREFTPKRKKPSFSKKYLVACAQAIFYEPGDVAGQSDDEPRSYLHQPPSALELCPYTKSFAVAATELRDDGPPILFCGGNSDNSGSCHAFLEEEGTELCKSCENVFCSFCVIKENKKDEHVHCFSCYSDLLVTRGIPIEDGPSRNEMETFLGRECNFQGLEKATLLELTEMYEAVHQNKILSQPNPPKRVKYPLISSEKISGLATICTFNFVEGARFIRNDVLNDRHRIDVLIMLSKLIEFGRCAPDHKGSAKAVYSAVSDQLVDWMNNSRFDTGFRLLSRACRHAHDDNCPDLYRASGEIVEYEGKTCLRIDATIRASMKDQEYQTCVVISDSDLIACSCTCPAGSCGSERHVDVHVGALVQKLCLLMFDGLGEHLLYEVAAQWYLSEPEVGTIEKAVLLDAIGLLKLCGQRTKQMEKIDPKTTITEYLQEFDVLTNNVKKWKVPALPLKNDKPLGLLREDCFVSPGTKNRNTVLKMKSESILDGGKDHSIPTSEIAAEHCASPRKFNMDQLTGPDYIFTALSLEVLAEFVKPSLEHANAHAVGPALLELRCTRAIQKRGWELLATKTVKLGMRHHFRDASGTTEQRSRPQRKSSSNTEIVEVGLEPLQLAPVLPPKTTDTIMSRPKKCPTKCCSVAWCKNNNRNSSFSFKRVPPGSNTEPLQSMKKYELQTIAENNFIRKEWLDRLGLGRTGKVLTDKIPRRDPLRCELRICSNHEYEQVVKTVEYAYYILLDNGTMEEVKEQSRIAFQAIKPCGAKSFHNPATTDNKGGGSTRFLIVLGTTISNQTNGDMALAFQQFAEMNGPNGNNLSTMNKVVERVFGFPDSEKANEKKHASHSKKRLRSDEKENKRKKRTWDCEPVVNLTMSAEEVKRRTGFVDMYALLRFAFIVCNGSIPFVTSRETSLTWLEEWFMYFEWTWGRSVQRYVDVMATYYVNDKAARSIVRRKRGIVLHARKCWPFFASHEEDTQLRQEKWGDRYISERVVFWDDTNINLSTPSDASLNRRTYSSYYSGNVGKGAVFIQLCGWLGVWHLWSGAVSDSAYLTNSGILQKQQQFAATDDTSDIPFTIVTDKGYRCTAAVWAAGKQTIIQPTFAQCDQQFTTNQLLTSAAIATDRGGNERAVNVCKRSGLLQRGLTTHGSLEDLDDTWLGWSFQTNFMYDPVL